MNIIKSFRPVYREDDMEWQELVQHIRNVPPLFWYGGAAFDFKPVIALFNGVFPKEARDLLSPGIFPVLTDYSLDILETMKYIYENFDKENFFVDRLPGGYWFTSQLRGITILQMIPLSLFDPSTLARVRKEYHGCFHPSVTSSVIPDDEWHFVFLNVELNGQEFGVVYGLIENLTFWKEVVEVYALNVEAFCALKVGGKSGSWDYTHSPKRGRLFNSIRTSKINKPRLWIADDCLELRNIWREINPHEDGFYGQMHFFETRWDKLE